MYRFCIMLIFYVGTNGSFIESFAQRQYQGIIAGRIIDADSGSAIENAIVFLSNTPFGISSGKDGRFVITNIPSGVYQLVVSRAGYEQQTFSVEVEKVESLYYEIRLQAQPVQMEEVHVLGRRIEQATPSVKFQYLFFPKDSPDTYCIYASGPSGPIGIFFSDSAFYMYSLDTATIDGEKYMRIRLLYENLSQSPYDLDPAKITRLHIQGKLHSYDDISPDRPSTILTKIDNEKAIDEVNERMGKVLTAFAVMQTRSADLEEYFDRWAPTTGPFMYSHGKFSPSRKGSLSANLYTIFSGSFNSGILKRYTVYPHNSVNGFIYFPFPGLHWKAGASGITEATEYVYTVELITQSGSKFIEFVPH